MTLRIFVNEDFINSFKGVIPMNGYKYTSHVFHFIMSILTGGLWLWVWLIVGLSNAQHNKKIDRERMGVKHYLDE